jgi:hypothetical protein
VLHRRKRLPGAVRMKVEFFSSAHLIMVDKYTKKPLFRVAVDKMYLLEYITG